VANLLRLYQTYFRVLGAVAPGLASAQAARLFLTPLPRRSASRWPEALQASLRHQPTTWNGRTLDCWSWGQGPRVLLVHGWGGLAAHMAGLVAPLVERGFEVMAFDGPAHGGSAGKRTSVIEFSEVILQVAQQSGGLHAIVGHSLGASATLIAVERGVKASAAVLISPFTSSALNIDHFADVLLLSPRVRQRLHDRLLRTFAAHTRYWTLAPLCRGFRQPALIVHDEQDRDIPYSEGVAISKEWPGARLLSTRALGHHKILRDPGVAAQVTDFVAGHSAAAASDAAATRPMR
jgi:pimeloyl-ACP methyl ester carboxylesterase